MKNPVDSFAAALRAARARRHLTQKGTGGETAYERPYHH